MNRRRFIGTLMASLGAAAAIDPKHLLWTPPVNIGPRELAELPPLLTGAPITLQSVTMAIARGLGDQLKGSTLHMAAHGIGNWPMAHQFSVSCLPPWEVGPSGFDKTHVEPIIEAFVQQLLRDKIRHFGLLPRPIRSDLRSSIVWSRDYGISVRGIEAVVFDAQLGEFIPQMRFDVLGG